MINRNESLLRQLILEKKLEGVLFDLDDTLIKTSEVFFAALDKVTKLYSSVLPNLNYKQILEILSKINIAAYQHRAVNPNRWEIVIPEFEKQLELEKHQIGGELSYQASEIFASIYTQQIEFEEGAEEVLNFLKSWRQLVGLVTHANIEWTLFKLESLGLGKFFDHVEIVDENRLHKNSGDWSGAATAIHRLPQQLLAVGDNIQGDVQAAVEAGSPAVWVDKKGGWSHYRVGELPSGIVVVKGVRKLLTP